MKDELTFRLNGWAAAFPISPRISHPTIATELLTIAVRCVSKGENGDCQPFPSYL